MPIYEYTCGSCHKGFEHLARRMTDAASAPAVECPHCKSNKTARALSVFAVGGEAPARSAAGPAAGCGRCGGPGPCSMG